MADNSLTYTKMLVLHCLKSLTLSAVGNDDRMLRNKFVVVSKCPGGRDTINCQIPVLQPGTHREANARGLPGGMLAVEIDSHISLSIQFNEIDNIILKGHICCQKLGNILTATYRYI